MTKLLFLDNFEIHHHLHTSEYIVELFCDVSSLLSFVMLVMMLPGTTWLPGGLKWAGDMVPGMLQAG